MARRERNNERRERNSERSSEGEFTPRYFQIFDMTSNVRVRNEDSGIRYLEMPYFLMSIFGAMPNGNINDGSSNENAVELIISIPTVIIQFNFKSFLRKRGKILRKKLKKSKMYVFKEGMDEKECSICMNSFEDEDKIRVLKCKHEFHLGCVEKWVCSGKDNCPMCRSTDIFGE